MADDQIANDECGICLETLNSAVTLPCNHKFCANCLDGWKSKFASSIFSLKKENKSKLCPLCRKEIPPSKDMLLQLDFHLRQKRELEADGDTSSGYYMNHVESIKRLEEEIGDYEGEGIDYNVCMELPKNIFDAVTNNDLKSVMDWLGSPVDKKRLSARYPDHVNSTLVHLAVYTKKSGLLSILLQYGADVNSFDAVGRNPLMLVAATNGEFGTGIDHAKILLEWGVEISTPRSLSHLNEEYGISSKDSFIGVTKIAGHNKLANLISSEFGGRRCEVINLPNHPHLNGKTCVVEKYITKKERYKVIFEGSGNAALVGPNNLKRRDRTPLDCGYYITFKNDRMTRREFTTKEECQAYVSSLGGEGDVKETAEELESLKL